MKKTVFLILILILAAGILCGCDSSEKKLEALCGSWSGTFADDPAEALAVLENVDAYAEEIALASLDSLEYAKRYEFDRDMTYRFYLDAQSTRACVRRFFLDFFDDLYQGRASLQGVYEADVSAMSLEEFNQFYADIYGYSDFDTLVDALVENAYDYAALESPYETGTFYLDGDKLMCTIAGETKPEAVAYSISADGTTLTMGFADATEVFTKAAG